MNISARCPRCYEVTNPYKMEITKANDVRLFYECSCGWKWRTTRFTNATVDLIGERHIPTLREYLREP